MTTNLRRPQIQAAAVRKPTTRTHSRHLESESGYEDSIFSKCSEFEVEVSAESEYEDGYLCTPLSLPNVINPRKPHNDEKEGHSLLKNDWETPILDFRLRDMLELIRQ